MEESILLSVKALLGADADYDVFDRDIVIFINSTIATLTQLGIGPSDGFEITGEEETWEDFLGEDMRRINSVKTYIFMKVRLAFDPPASSYVLSAYEDSCKEFEWRLNVAVDPGTYK